jgi:hypothetical protein
MHMNLFRLGIVCVAVLAIASCSKKSTAENDREKENQFSAKADERSGEKESSKEDNLQPEAEDIGEDCVAFLRSTVSNRTDGAGQCPVCPSSAEKAEVLGVDSVRVEKVNNAGTDWTSCEANVEIRAHFNPSNGGTITGGLVGWIPAEQRTQYMRGVTPSGQQVYHVSITYRREGDEWQAADFARP